MFILFVGLALIALLPPVTNLKLVIKLALITILILGTLPVIIYTRSELESIASALIVLAVLAELGYNWRKNYYTRKVIEDLDNVRILPALTDSIGYKSEVLDSKTVDIEAIKAAIANNNLKELFKDD